MAGGITRSHYGTGEAPRMKIRGHSGEPETTTVGSCRARPKVSVVISCRNERDHIGRCVQSVLASESPGDLEVIVVDGMSSDGTREILGAIQERCPAVRVVDNPKRTTPAAVNIGVREADGDVVVTLGAHCELSPGYIRAVTGLLLSRTEVGCAGGRTVPRATRGSFQKVLAAVLASPFGVGNSYFRVATSGRREVDTVAYGAYWKDVVDRAGGFDERLTRNQDIELNHRVRRLGYKILLDPSAVVYYEPRPSLRAFARQSFGNGFWNIVTWTVTPGSLSWRHFVPLAFVLSTIALGLTGTLLPPAHALLCVMLGVYGFLSLAESLRLACQAREPLLLVASLVFPVLHVSYGSGSACGIGFVLLRRREGGSNAGAP